MIGAVAGHLTDVGFGETFWPFVVGHGAFELTAIALAGAAGLESWLGADWRPGAWRAAKHCDVAARKRVLPGRAGSCCSCLIAAFIEAYWSSMTWVAPRTLNIWLAP
jgi:uncharacterized membrane protein SpoIIM required for sporulation